MSNRDERFDQRYPACVDIQVTGLTDRTQVSRGQVSDISRSGLCVIVPIRFAPGDLVKLEFADSLLFGYVIYSNPEEKGFRSGIEVERVLLGGTTLSRMLQSILKREMPHVPGLEPALP